MKIYNPRAEGIKFQCDQCKKVYEVKNGKHQEITDRLQLENFPGDQGGEQTICDDCWKNREDSGLNESTSIQV